MSFRVKKILQTRKMIQIRKKAKSGKVPLASNILPSFLLEHLLAVQESVLVGLLVVVGLPVVEAEFLPRHLPGGVGPHHLPLRRAPVPRQPLLLKDRRQLLHLKRDRNHRVHRLKQGMKVLQVSCYRGLNEHHKCL